jgi:voltage-gated potassium channel
MLLDLVVLGLGIQVILGAVKRGKANADTETV